MILCPSLRNIHTYKSEFEGVVNTFTCKDTEQLFMFTYVLRRLHVVEEVPVQSLCCV